MTIALIAPADETERRRRKAEPGLLAYFYLSSFSEEKEAKRLSQAAAISRHSGPPN
ncbi:hypothetical protein NON00_02800 [Roseomonas sp. GC11]|uniref:hypothetical protein n=1 Tax=Roseomonas sp. GC11 TaxID=2950546 RepID=UPI00210906D5|nr:hypothetical protein [Roseomonas sp. GC11]MCQ4158855.1 hypothetical protein [Roseomonas sp. GC11]